MSTTTPSSAGGEGYKDSHGNVMNEMIVPAPQVDTTPEETMEKLLSPLFGRIDYKHTKAIDEFIKKMYKDCCVMREIIDRSECTCIGLGDNISACKRCEELSDVSDYNKPL